MRRTIFILALGLLALAFPATVAAKVPGSFYGVSSVDPTQKDFSRIDKTGFGVARFEISWRVLQKTRKGGIDWGYVETRMRDIAEAGLKPAPIVFGTPRFIRKSPNGFYPPTSSKEDRKEWQDFLTAATRRYGPGGSFWDENPGIPEAPVRQWIIWNEPNANAFWQPKPKPRDYAKLVKISDRAISKVDPKANIVLGGMAGFPKSSSSMTAVKFLKGFYKVKRIERHFESINLHPYGPGVGAVRKQVKQARSAVRKAGDKNVGILIGEVGWASKGPKKAEEVVGAKGQANRLRKSLKMLAGKRKAWNITAAYVYIWRDFSIESGCLWCPTAGLVKIDGKAKPALKAVRDVIRATR